jgi:hypothetical protein
MVDTVFGTTQQVYRRQTAQLLSLSLSGSNFQAGAKSRSKMTGWFKKATSNKTMDRIVSVENSTKPGKGPMEK